MKKATATSHGTNCLPESSGDAEDDTATQINPATMLSVRASIPVA
jgi:hypothetical protein